MGHSGTLENTNVSTTADPLAAVRSPTCSKHTVGTYHVSCAVSHHHCTELALRDECHLSYCNNEVTGSKNRVQASKKEKGLEEKCQLSPGVHVDICAHALTLVLQSISPSVLCYYLAGAVWWTKNSSMTFSLFTVGRQKFIDWYWYFHSAKSHSFSLQFSRSKEMWDKGYEQWNAMRKTAGPRGKGTRGRVCLLHVSRERTKKREETETMGKFLLTSAEISWTIWQTK